MASFDADLLAAIEGEREADLTTFGRKTGQPHRVTIWFIGDNGRVFVRAGGGLGRDWPRNLLANGRGILHLAGRDAPVRARHVAEPAEARAIAALRNRKYNPPAPISAEGEPATPAEQATFELLPAD